ncbi:unnamed protein product, partial [Nesidiocoris tenuis]
MSESWLTRIIIGDMSLESYNKIQRYARVEFTPLVEFLMMFPPLESLYIMTIFVPIAIGIYLIYTVLLTISCVYMRHDFVMWSEIIHHTLIVYLGIFINGVIFLRRSDLLGLTVDYMNGVYHYKDLSVMDETFDRLKKDNVSLQRSLFKLPVVIIAVTGTTLCLKPFIDMLMDVHPNKIL